MPIDLKNLKIIDAKEVPSRRFGVNWEALLRKIPEGKAVIFENQEVSYTGLRGGLKRTKEKFPEEFESYYIVCRTKNEKSRFYIVNPKKL